MVVEAAGEVFGEAPNVAARVQGLAEPGAVLVTANVQRQTAGLFVAEDKGVHELKGVPAPVTLYRIVRASGGRRSGARTLTPLVGRDEELGHLRRRWERARAGAGQLTLVVGEPGIGKSRLVEEFRATLAETPHTFVELSSSQLLQNTPLHAITEWGRQRFGADEPADRRLADLENTLRLIGLDASEYAPLIAPLVDIPLPEGRAAKLAPEELRRRQLAALVSWFLAGARSQPVALAFEDLHWADPTSLDLMQALAERGAQAPMLILATARPEFRAPWSLRSHHSVISLSPLDRADVAQMVGELAARHALSKEVVEGVSERTGGVPLFVEEVTRLLLERGEAGGLQSIPPTLQQSLAARLDRLGEAREVAQIGAVLGRDFTYSLLSAVGEVEDLALQSALDKLAGADLLIAEGAGHEANYRFKHALIQDAAYDSLLKSRRHALHRRAAEILRDSAERAAAEPEVIAHHFTEAGLDDLAIEWWGKSGDQALRRSAFQEAIAHLGKAIAMADKAAGVSGQGQNLHVAYGNALLAARGYGAPETTEAFARARESSASDKDAPERLAADWGLWVGSYVRGELPAMREYLRAFLSDVAARPDSPEAGVAHRAAGITHWYAGEYLEAREHLERALALFQPGRDDDLAFRFGQDPGAAAMLLQAIVSWPLGEVDRAISLVERAQERTAGLAHVGTHAFVKMRAAMFEMICGRPARASPNAGELAQLAREHKLSMDGAFGVFLEGWTNAEGGAAGAGLEGMRRGVELLREQNVLVFDGLLKTALAEAEARAGDVDRAIALLDEALATCGRTGYRAFESELHRVRGEMLLKRDPANPAPAEEVLQTAIAVAKQQATRSFELRAALSLAKLYQSTSRPVDAHAVLAPALEGFSPTPEMPEIAEAQTLLRVLSQSDEVKAEAAQRHRMTQLQVAYGNALMAARGFGAPEATEAFVRARESASGDKDAPDRLAVDYGLWAGSYNRGELPSMRAQAAVFLNDLEARPDSPEAGVAHRAAAVTHWFAGEYREARDHLERALALFQPGRDDDLAFRFGLDPGVAAMGFLANVSWPLGEVDHALSFIDRLHTRMGRVSHIASRSWGTMNSALLDLMRGDHARAAPKAFELVRLAREHELTMYGAFGVFLEGWAIAASGAPGDGLDDMRRGVELLREQNVLIFDGLLKIALAEAEARAGDPDRALVILDDALATSERTGHRAFEAELHRVRGEMLLKRDPADPAPAEEAFQTAIAVAQRQGTRSFELRASLALAKLYQSTGRPAEAHAVLAPALEDFSPTPEMPEIAEAQALLTALAETDEVKAAEAQRQRLLELQTSYGKALMWGKGFIAEETKAAFARVAELAGTTDNSATRFVAYDAQQLRCCLRGEWRLARETAEKSLREAEAEGRAMEAGMACRAVGFVSLMQGDLKVARAVLERALADRNPARDAEARLVFGRDPESGAAAILAMAVWHLGEADWARELIHRAIRRADDLGHAASIVVAHSFLTLLESHRQDLPAARGAAEDVIRLTQKFGIQFYGDQARIFASLVRGRLLDAGASELGRALAAYIEQGNKMAAPFFHGLLAELEVNAPGPESALALIDQGLAIANETGEHLTDAYLHRLRGDILLKREPSNTAPAEEAYRTAIAVAKEQGARSFGLRAALSLAKLYQSTGRPVEAHVVLAPALEGFSPTPEMPEIAEAQVLLSRLT